MSTQATKGRERQEKILQALYEVSGGTTRVCAYEDIVVKAWQMYPEEFGLRGYVRQYPDASDLHKPLYGPMKREGLVRNASKKFGLTDRGLAIADRLRCGEDGTSRGRLERHQKDELLRLARRPAVQLLGQNDDLLDTDLYDFYGVTVRTEPGEFAGRIRTVDEAIDAAVETRDPAVGLEQVAAVVATRDALRGRFGGLITVRAAAKNRS